MHDLHAGISSVAVPRLWSDGESPLSGDSRMVDHNFVLIFAFCSYLCSSLPLSVGLELTIGSLLLLVFVFSCLLVGLEWKLNKSFILEQLFYNFYFIHYRRINNPWIGFFSVFFCCDLIDYIIIIASGYYLSPILMQAWAALMFCWV